MTNIEADDLRKTFGANVRMAREQAGWTQGDLAERLKDYFMTRDKVLRMESGTRPTPLEEAAGIAQVLGYRLDELLLPERGISLQGQLRAQVHRTFESRKKAGEHLGSLLVNRAELKRLLDEVSEDSPIALQDTWEMASGAYDGTSVWLALYDATVKYIGITEGLAPDAVHEWIRAHGELGAVMESVTGLRLVDDDE